MVLYGASGHSLVVKDILELIGDNVNFYVDDDHKKATYKGITVISQLNSEKLIDESVIVTIGDNHNRKRIAEKISNPFKQAIAPNAYVSKSAQIGDGSVVFFNALIQANVKIGKHVIINNSASVDHECEIGDYAHIAPGAVLCGAVVVGECTMVGAGATIIQCVKIGSNVTIGAGSVVIHDIPDNAVVVGNPARIIKYNHE